MAERDFALPKSSYPELLKMVHAYFLADRKSRGEPVSVPEVARSAAMNRTTLSRNNAFFASIGIIEGGQKKRLTETGRELGLGVSHDSDDRIRSALSRLVDESDFLSQAVSAVRVRSGMDFGALQSHIAISAGERRSPDTLTGAGALIHLLIASGYLSDDGGTLRAASPGARSPASDEGEVTVRDFVTTTSSEPRIIRSYYDTLSGYYRLPTTQGMTVNIILQVDAKNVDEVLELLRRLSGHATEPEASDQDLSD